MASSKDVIRRSPSGPIVERLDGNGGNGNGGPGSGGVERIGALQAIAAATATGADFVPIPSGAATPLVPDLEVAFADVELGRSVLVLGTVTFLNATSSSLPEIRAELSVDGGTTFSEILESNASQPPVVGRGNIALSCVSAPLTAKAADLRARLTWRANPPPSGDAPPTDETFGIDPAAGANAQIIAAIVPGIPRP